jgi:inositol transport system ATP-binding protein
VELGSARHAATTEVKLDSLLAVSDVSKSFWGVKALLRVRLDVRAGEVHAVAGENGAGKSTLMKILAGMYPPDSGEVIFHGRGVSMIHQELLPFPDLSVAENICMGQEPTRWLPGFVDKRAMNAKAQELLDRLRSAVPATRVMRDLSVAEMQTVEIAKALARDADLIIMDEPTSALSDREVEALYAVIEYLKQRGIAVIYISHKLDEILRIADRVTVLRDGQHVATHAIGEIDENRLIALMVGRELSTVFPKSESEPGEVALEVRALGKSGRFRNVSFSVRRGEIVGIAGLMGAGRTDVAAAICGLEPADTGEIILNGKRIAMVSEDRKKFGLVPDMSVEHNLTLASLARCCNGPVINHRMEGRVADEQIRIFAIRTPDRHQQVKHLSGGNQQKVVIANALLTNPAVLILNEPTRGIDIGAKAEIYALITRLAHDGMAIIMVSSEMNEILALSDRILVMREGEVSGELSPRDTTPEQILQYAMPK